MPPHELPPRPKLQRLLKRATAAKTREFQLYSQQARTITSPVELLPGLNDISDAFEALPLDLVKYFTLLKEIDAKCINTVPQINRSIKTYIDEIHSQTLAEKVAETASNHPALSTSTSTSTAKGKQLAKIRDRLHEIIPYLEEKMHVTSVATDLLHKHMFRINNDYKLIIQNNEIPELIRIGPLNHPAMIMDLSGPLDGLNPNRSAQLQRSESRREALAAKKASKDTFDDEDEVPGPGKKRKGAAARESAALGSESSAPATTLASGRGNLLRLGNPSNGLGPKKRHRKETDDPVRSTTPAATSVTTPTSQTTTASSNSSNYTTVAKKRTTKPRRDDDSAAPGALLPGSEPTYCYCNQVSFGEMVGCDGDDCKREWFHLPCIGFKNPPKGKWYCDECLVKMKKRKVV